jgi:hypothetical protein
MRTNFTYFAKPRAKIGAIHLQAVFVCDKLAVPFFHYGVSIAGIICGLDAQGLEGIGSRTRRRRRMVAMMLATTCFCGIAIVVVRHRQRL